MLKLNGTLVVDLLTLAGFIAFFVVAGMSNPWLLLPAVLFAISLLKQPKWNFAFFESFCFFPFASGLLILPMRLFYWDRFDFAGRIQNLLLLAALFTVWLISRQQHWWKKIRCNFNARKLKKRLWIIFLTAELSFIAAAALITSKGVALGGDEPHYLAISQSLARDHDLNVFNQYFRDGFKEFLNVDKLAAHGTWGKGYKKIYSYHLPGISLTLVPFFFFKLSPPLLYFLLRAFLGLFGALLAVMVYLFCLRLWRSRRLAFFATLVFTFSAPVFFYSFHIFPEIQAMLLILSALYLLLFKVKGNDSRCLWAGLLLGSTIFWGVKYALFIYPIAIGFFVYWLWQKKFRPALLLIAFPLLFQALFFYYLYSAYGNFSPNSVYYGMLSPEGTKAFYETILNKITLTMRWETLLDYFFDQRDGLLLYNPFYFFAFPGLLLALKNFKRYRLHLLAALPAILFIGNHAFSTIRPGYCPQGRYLTPVVWVLLLFALIYYRESHSPFFKKIFLTLPLYSLFVAAYQTAQPFTLYQATTHDQLLRPGLMFQNWSNSRIDLPALLPSYIKTANRGYLPNIVFLVIFVLLVAFTLIRVRSGKERSVRGLVPGVIFVVIFALASLFPRPDLANPQQLPGPRDLPCRVYFTPEAEAGSAAATWLSSGTHCRLLIETLVPLKSVQIRIQNRSALKSLQITVSLFDAAASGMELRPKAAGEVRLDQPRFKKIRSHYGYQFELHARNVPAKTMPAWLLGLKLR